MISVVNRASGEVRAVLARVGWYSPTA